MNQRHKHVLTSDTTILSKLHRLLTCLYAKQCTAYTSTTPNNQKCLQIAQAEMHDNRGAICIVSTETVEESPYLFACVVADNHDAFSEALEV